MSPQRLQQQLRQWLKSRSPQQELQQRTRQNIRSTSAKQVELNTRQEAQAFCIPPRKRLTMQLRKISCCFLFETMQQLRYQVFCCLAILNAQQLRQQWMPVSHFSWLSSYYPQEPNKSLQPQFLMTLSSWLMYWLWREQRLLHIFLMTLSIVQTIFQVCSFNDYRRQFKRQRQTPKVDCNLLQKIPSLPQRLQDILWGRMGATAASRWTHRPRRLHWPRRLCRPRLVTYVCRLILGRILEWHGNSILRKLSTFYLLFLSPQHRQICRQTAPTRYIFRAT